MIESELINREIALAYLQENIVEIKCVIIRMQKRKLEYMSSNEMSGEIEEAMASIDIAIKNIRSILSFVEEYEKFFQDKLIEDKRGMIFLRQ